MKILCFLLLGFMLSSIDARHTTTMIFPSKEALQEALAPLELENLLERIHTSKASVSLQFRYDPSLDFSKPPLPTHPSHNLLQHELYKTETLTLYYPEAPRVPHHLTIALNRENVESISALTLEENHALFKLIKKISEIYKSIDIKGFVIAQYDTSQQNDLRRHVVEIIPHLPGFQNIKNIPDKMDCNRYVLFRKAPLSPLYSPIDHAEYLQFWKTAFNETYPPLTAADTTITPPFSRQEAYRQEGEWVLQKHLIDILQQKGGIVEEDLGELTLPVDVPSTTHFVAVESCLFCDEKILKRQMVYEYGSAYLLYNVRKGAKPGMNFLILPKRHVTKVYDLNDNERESITLLRKALVETLKEREEGCEVVVYIQDDPATGQTVFHSHEQVVAIDPETIALTWTCACLYSDGLVTDQEMKQVREEFHTLLKTRLKS